MSRLIPAQVERPDLGVIHPVSDESLGVRAARNIAYVPTSAITWVANLAVFVPFGLVQPFTVTSVFWFNGSTVTSSNVDCGVYDTSGNRIITCGSTAMSGTSAPQTASVTRTVLAPGDYYLALCCDKTTSRLTGGTPVAVLAAGVGIGQVAKASVTLASTETIVPITNALVPFMGINGYSVNP